MAKHENPGESVAAGLESGQWYEVEFLTMQTKKLSGMFLVRFDSSQGSLVQFEGRYPFAIEVNRLVAAKPVPPPPRTTARHKV